MNLLEKLQELVDELNTTNSRKDKIEILKKYPHLQKILFYIYNPYKKFRITSKNCIKLKSKLSNQILQNKSNIVDWNDDKLFAVLDSLVDGSLSGHSAIKTINSLVDSYPIYQELIYRIVDKDIKCRIGSKDINKAFTDLIPEFEVALADKYQDKNIKLVNEDWFISRKLDGVRCLAILDGKVTLYSRQGNEFKTLQKIAELLEPYNARNIVLDGAICVIHDDGADDFKGVLQEITRKDHTMENPTYLVFDFLTLEEFNSKTSKTVFYDRLVKAEDFIDEIDNDRIKLLEQVTYSSEKFKEMEDEVAKLGWEGLIVRKKCEYKGKRSKDILKVKTFFDEEFEVKSVWMSTKQCIREGKNVEIPTIGAAIIEYKGNPVGVGSGWTEAERIYYHDNPNELIGKIITVRYKQETKDENGKPSLQFPVIKVVHGKERIT